MIYTVNPVGWSFGLAAGLSICAFFGLLGDAGAVSPLIALVVAFVMTPLMGLHPRALLY